MNNETITREVDNNKCVVIKEAKFIMSKLLQMSQSNENYTLMDCTDCSCDSNCSECYRG